MKPENNPSSTYSTEKPNGANQGQNNPEQSNEEQPDPKTSTSLTEKPNGANQGQNNPDQSNKEQPDPKTSTSLTEKPNRANQGRTNKKNDPQKSLRYIIISNIALIVWGILLGVIGIYAAKKQASIIIWELPANVLKLLDISRDQSNEDGQGDICKDANIELSKYIIKNYSGQNKSLIPPIATVLDRLQTSISWREPTDIYSKNQKTITCKDYQNLFAIVDERLQQISISYSPTSGEPDIQQIHNNILPAKFRINTAEYSFEEKPIDLPLEARFWMERMEGKNEEIQDTISFLDLFVLLIILGGFGSWVYLIRLHLEEGRVVQLEEYLYRPVLGMGLALAIFIMNLSVHSVVSKSEIDKVRQEPLIVLAFIAGFLSDKTYSSIEHKATKNMEEEKK